LRIKEQQARYHDWEAPRYNAKWAISFDRRCRDYVAGRYLRAVPSGRAYDDVLEVGCGTGFFGLNLWQAGVARRLYALDLSVGMVARCVDNGGRLGVAVRGAVADAEALPYPDASFDLVAGHAVLHHLPDVDAAVAELVRVLRPGGRLLIAGEPTVVGDRVAAWFKRTARVGVTLAAVVAGADRVLADGAEALPADERATAALEHEVDLHTFDPGELEEVARRAGLVGVRCATEELTANWFGWLTRTVEGRVRPGVLPPGYAPAAYRTWRALSALDEPLRRVVPREAFYNAVLTGVAPEAPVAAAGLRPPLVARDGA